MSPPQTAAQRAGITAAQLAERVPTMAGIEPINPDALETWLLDGGLAEHDGDFLFPTEKTLTVASALD